MKFDIIFEHCSDCMLNLITILSRFICPLMWNIQSFCRRLNLFVTFALQLVYVINQLMKTLNNYFKDRKTLKKLNESDSAPSWFAAADLTLFIQLWLVAHSLSPSIHLSRFLVLPKSCCDPESRNSSWVLRQASGTAEQILQRDDSMTPIRTCLLLIAHNYEA